MKKHFLILFFVFAMGQAWAQKAFFSTEKPAFFEQLSVYLGSSTVKQERDEAAAIMKGFEGVWNSYYSDSEQNTIMQLCELLHTKSSGKPYLNIFNFVEVLQRIPTAGLTHKEVSNWLNYTDLKAKTSLNGIDKYMASCRSLFVENVLSAKGNSQWLLRDASIGFPSDQAFELTVDGTLVLASHKDESIINQTKGVYYLEDNHWEGTGGRVDWSRFGVPTEQVFALLPDYYTIDLSRSEYGIDSVVFYDKNFFGEAMLGRFEDKVMVNTPNERTMYPRAFSYRSDYEMPNIFNGVDFRGGFGVMGNQIEVFGGPHSKASFLFKRGGRTVMRAESKRFVMSEDEILKADHAALRLYLLDTVTMETDSLYHNNLGFRYNNKKRNIMAYRSEKDFGDAPFHDLYHGMDLFIEAMYWNLGETYIDFMRMEGVNPTSQGELVSVNYFRFNEFKKLQGLDPVHPMVRLERFLSGFDNVERQFRFALGDFASFISFPIEQVLALILRLQAEGFVEYDIETQWVTVLPRYFDVLDASRDSIDFDVIKLQTLTKNRQPNIRIDLNTNDMLVFGLISQLDGVEDATIALSDRKQVVIVPDNNRIILKKDRNFQFSGGILAGMFEFYTKDCLFSYKDFTIEMNKVDSLRFYARDGHQVVPIQGTLERLQGRLKIDQGDNKSSRLETPDYPIFHSEEPAFKFYRKINGGVFHPGAVDSVMTADDLEGKFYYRVHPFVIDSLTDFSMRHVRFDGELVSGGIFPDIEEPLVIMDDYSLGFVHQIGNGETDSYPMYGDLGRFHQNVVLSENGFVGNGQLDYQTATFNSDRFVFYLDSVSGITNQFRMEPMADGSLYPVANADALKLKWDIHKPELTTQTIGNPIQLYGDTQFTGMTRLTPEGYSADGTLRFGLTEFSSENFDFDAQTFVADTADFRLFAADSTTVAFAATNYRANVDFDAQKVQYDYLDGTSTLDFPMNRFICSLKEAEWDMSTNMLNVYNPVESFGDYATATTHEELLAIHSNASKFISLVPEHDSLQFYSMSAEYDMTNYIIHAHDVKIIRVADAAVFPYEHDVDINPESKLDPVHGELLADTLNTYHLIKDAIVNIHSRKHYDAHGVWDYVDAHGTATPILMDTVMPIGGITHAFAHIADTTEFKLSTQFGFQGRLTLKATQRHGLFDGQFALLAFEEPERIALPELSETAMDSTSMETETLLEENPELTTPDIVGQPVLDTMPALNNWFVATANINPQRISIPIEMEKVRKANPKMCNGLYYEKAIDGGYFASFLTPKEKRPETIDAVAPINGQLWFDADSIRFVVTDTTQYDTYVELNRQGVVGGQGSSNLGFDVALTQFVWHGNYEQYPNDSLTISGLNLFNAPILDDKVLGAIAEVYAAIEGASIDLTQTPFLHYFRSENNEEKTEEMRKSIELAGYPQMESSDFYCNTIVIPDLKMVWNPKLNAFVSVGKIGLGHLGKHVVNRYVDGYVVFDRRLGNISYYFQNDMFMTYINYNIGDRQLQIHATYGDINQTLYDTKEKNRTVKRGEDSFVYVAVPYEAMLDFLNKLRYAGVE